MSRKMNMCRRIIKFISIPSTRMIAVIYYMAADDLALDGRVVGTLDVTIAVEKLKTVMITGETEDYSVYVYTGDVELLNRRANMCVVLLSAMIGPELFTDLASVLTQTWTATFSGRHNTEIQRSLLWPLLSSATARESVMIATFCEVVDWLLWHYTVWIRDFCFCVHTHTLLSGAPLLAWFNFDPSMDK